MTKQEILLEKKRVITVQGRDKAGRPIVRIVGKNFPGTVAETRHTRQYVRVGLVTRAGVSFLLALQRGSWAAAGTRRRR